MKKLLLLLSIILFFKNTDAQCPQYLNIDTNVCGSGCVTANATILRSRLCGDSLVIIYNATQGTTGLVGASKVYMHSGPEFVPFTGWQTAYTKGNYGLDDGVGKMDSIGPNLWRIVINPRTYYNYPAGNCLNAIFMVRSPVRNGR